MKKATDIRYTPPELTRAMLARLDLPPMVVAEPCAGDGWISRELEAAGHDVLTGDVDPTKTALEFPGVDFFSAHAARAYQTVEAIITNPPWSDASRYVERALELCPRVVMLLRLTFQEPCDDRAGLLSSPHLRRIIVLPRSSFYQGASGTDSVPPCWFVWEPEPGPCVWEVVTKTQLAEAAGQGTLFGEVAS